MNEPELLKIGDTVRCLEPAGYGNLVLGELYQVDSCDYTYPQVIVVKQQEELIGEYFASRFEKVNPFVERVKAINQQNDGTGTSR